MEKNKNVPKLRFPEFTGEWEEKKLGEIAEINSKKYNPEKESISYKCIELEHLASEIGQLLGFIDSCNSKSIKNRFEKGDVLYGKLRPYLKKYLLAPFVGVCSSEIWVLRGKEVSNKFLYQIIKTDLFTSLANQSTGSKMPRADWGVLSDADFCFPNQKEQTQIASFLTAVDVKLTQLKKKKTILEQYKKGIMQKLFSQELRFKDNNNQDFPDWQEKKIGEILTIGSGRDYKHLSEGNIPVFGTGGLMTKVNDFLYEGETVCIGRKGTIDKPMYYSGKIWTVDTLFYTHSFINVYPKFVYCIFLMINWKEYNEASGVPSLSKSTIEKIEINIPSLPEQQKIATFLSAIDEKISHSSAQIEKMESWKKGLLQQMFC